MAQEVSLTYQEPPVWNVITMNCPTVNSEYKRQKVQCHQETHQKRFPVTKGMLQMIPFGLEHVMVFILTFPTSTTIPDNCLHAAICYLEIGHKWIVIDLFTIIFSGDRYFTPVDLQSVGGRRGWQSCQYQMVFPPPRNPPPTSIHAIMETCWIP